MMNSIYHLSLTVLHKGYIKLFGAPKSGESFYVERNPDKVSDMIYQLLTSDKPCMIARFGAFELSTIVNYLGVTNPHHSAWKYIKGEQPQRWWNKKLMGYMQSNAGFFPATEEKLSQFCEMMIKDAQEVDLLGSWLKDEDLLLTGNKQVKKIGWKELKPFWSESPWTKALKGKNILVIHPFEKTIVKQYTLHEKLFKNKEILPSFHLETIPAVQSLGGDSTFNDWFEALQWMEDEIDKHDYDIALIGCGAYGFPLAAHVKRRGKKAVHLAGTLQLLFGIIGSRWEHDELYNQLFNEYWCRPNENEKPQTANHVENGCYW